MKEITKSLKCVVLNGNIEKWLETDKADIIASAVKRGDKFVEIQGELINTFSIVGIFNPETMAEKTRRKNGEWQCQHGEWWQKGDRTCHCMSAMRKEELKEKLEFVKKHYPYIEV